MLEEMAKGAVDGLKKQGLTCWYTFMIGLGVVAIINNIDSLKKL